MKYLLDVPDEITPDSMNPNSVEERTRLIVAFKHSKPVVLMESQKDVEKAIKLNCFLYAAEVA